MKNWTITEILEFIFQSPPTPEEMAVLIGFFFDEEREMQRSRPPPKKFWKRLWESIFGASSAERPELEISAQDLREINQEWARVCGLFRPLVRHNGIRRSEEIVANWPKNSPITAFLSLGLGELYISCELISQLFKFNNRPDLKFSNLPDEADLRITFEISGEKIARNFYLSFLSKQRLELLLGLEEGWTEEEAREKLTPFFKAMDRLRLGLPQWMTDEEVARIRAERLAAEIVG